MKQLLHLFASTALLTMVASLPLSAQTQVEKTQWFTDASQIISGAGTNPQNLIDGDPSTTWTSDGNSFTIKLPDGLNILDGRPFQISFTIPAAGDNYPTAFAVYGLHEGDGENVLGYTTSKINFDGTTEYTSPIFYVRGGFNNQWWYCNQLRFECTQTPNAEIEPSQFELADFKVYESKNYHIGIGPILENNGDIINAKEDYQDKGWYSSLIDGDSSTYWKANDREWIWSDCKFKSTGLVIKFSSIANETTYQLKIVSPKGDDYNSFPTKMRWMYQTSDGGNWEEGEELDMSEIAEGATFETDFTIKPEYYRLAFLTVENRGNVKIAEWAGGYPNTVLAEFQFYGPKKIYEPNEIPDPLPDLGKQYPNPNLYSLNQEYFKNKLYSSKLDGYNFIHTHGIVDKDFDNNFVSDGGWITNKEIWDQDGDLVDGYQVPGADLGVALPNFRYDAPVNNENILPVGGDRRRQPTTTTLHDVYVIPGERVDLLPFSDITLTYAYLEDFYRFYDYRTDKAHEDVYFLFNPKAGAYNDYGIFGGAGLGYVFDDRDYGHLNWGDPQPMSQRGAGGVASFYRPKEEDGLIDEYIAADFSQSYFNDGFINDKRAEDVRKFIDVKNKTIHEPIINFRHVFHVTDGRTLADDMSKDRAANTAYIAKNRRHILGRADNLLTIRLINPMPADEGIKANFYYRKQDGSYTRMGKYDIETYKYENGQTIGDNIDGMFKPYERSAYTTPNIDVETELNPEGANTPAWIRPNKKFYRAIACDAESAKEGRYLIRFLAKDPDGQRILLEDGKPLILREIVVDFLGEDKASFKLETEIIPEHHKEEYLEENFTYKSVVDFDKYRALTNEFLEPTENGARIKYPAPWRNSSYAFGYKYKQDYNAYTIASHTDAVPYAQACTSEADQHDRLWNNTGGKEQGFFYYANAAGDPGEMAKIDIPALCVGSTLHVSAWVNSMGVYSTGGPLLYGETEPANVIFNLIAVLKNGQEVSINSFTTGYAAKPEDDTDRGHHGKWMHVYYSVTPDFNDMSSNFKLEDVERYQVVLENNSVNSHGADYAIDDIRIYVAKPVVLASQLKPLCSGDKETLQRIDMPLKTLLNSLSIAEPTETDEGENIDLYYTIFDKDKYDSLMASENGYTEAVFNGSVLKYGYNGDDEVATWGKLTFNTKWTNNPEWRKDLEPNKASRHMVGDQKCVSFNILSKDEGMFPGKTYVAAVAVINGGDSPTYLDFNISDICTKQSEFTVQGSSVIKVDGIVRTNGEDLSVCENQFPTIQIDIVGIEAETGETRIIEECPLMDWYRGTLEDFNKVEYDGTLLAEALLNFRHVYPDAISTDQEFKSSSNGSFSYNETYKKTIDHFIAEGDLLFASYAYVASAVRIPEGQKSVECHIVAIPADREMETSFEGRDYIVCNDPTEIVITVDKRSPGLLEGFEGVDYPEHLQDVPIRMGLSQMKDRMYVPLRNIYIVTPNVAELQTAEDKNIYLVGTNDPAYRNLEDPDGDNPEGNGLRSVGTVHDIAAVKEINNGNALVEIDNINLREGYYYTLRFSYMEKPGDGQTPADVCDGQTIFTVKVVPEYQMWTGDVDGSLNFNNDGNWRRVTKEELLAGNSMDPRLITDGIQDGKTLNPNKLSYAPLNFTKVIIPAGAKYPHLFVPGKSEVYDVFDGKTNYQYTHPTGLSDNESAGAATNLMEYDLTVELVENALYCRPWYANTCEQIHFLSNAEIMNQQHLQYQKAWVDMEMKPDRWYTASSPLQGVVAGDMYLPTEGARQLTELFQPITFRKDVNDRFAPAVFQRGWDRGVANVYELPSSSADEISNVAMALDWSNVYNDVQEKYSAGIGYSINTDISKISGSAPDYVMFRLPKDDSGYEYWTEDGNDHGTENGGTIVRESPYRLNPVDATVTVANENEGKYFLVGNPFMAHIDMAEFLVANKETIEPKYWIANGRSHISAVMDPATKEFAGTVENPSALPPMQGFFVESKNAAKEITLKYTADMLTTVPWNADDEPLLRMSTRSADKPSPLLISARDESAGQDESRAMLLLSSTAKRGYADSEDAVMLDSRDSRGPRVYTIAGNRAVSVNATDNAEGVEIGIITDGDVATILRFDNVDAFDNLSLYDRLTEKAVPLSEGMEYVVEGSASGRLFLTAGINIPVADNSGLTVKVLGADVVASYPRADIDLDLYVYDLSGKTIASLHGAKGEARISNLDKGFYIVMAVTGDNVKSRKKS